MAEAVTKVPVKGELKKAEETSAVRNGDRSRLRRETTACSMISPSGSGVLRSAARLRRGAVLAPRTDVGRDPGDGRRRESNKPTDHRAAGG
jgi:hypothetical protein